MSHDSRERARRAGYAAGERLGRMANRRDGLRLAAALMILLLAFAIGSFFEKG